MSYLKSSYKSDQTKLNLLLIKGAFESIKMKLKDKEIKPTFIRKFLNKSHLFSFLGGSLLFLGLYLKIISLTIIGFILILYSGLSIYLYNRLKDETSILYNENKIEEKESFFQKYKEKIILILITSIISTTIGVLGTLLVQWISSP